MNNFDLIKDKIKDVYMNGNWNSVYGFLRKNNIKHSLHVEEFGLSGKKSRDKMKRWLNEEEENTIKFPLYSVSVRSSKTGFSYNKIRGQEIKLFI